MPTTTARSLRWEGDPYFHGVPYGSGRDRYAGFADEAANELMRELHSKGYDPTTGGVLLKNETDSFSVSEDRYSLIPQDQYSPNESRYDHPDAQVAHPPPLHNDEDDASRDPSYYLNSTSSSYSTQNDKTTFESSFGSYTDESGTYITEEGEDDEFDDDSDNRTAGSRRPATTKENPLRHTPPKTSGITKPKAVNSSTTKPFIPTIPASRRDQAKPLISLPTRNHGHGITTHTKKTLQVPPSPSYNSSMSQSTSSLSRFQELQRKKQKVKDLVKRFENREAFVPRSTITDMSLEQQKPKVDPPETQRRESGHVDNKKASVVLQRSNHTSSKTQQVQQISSNNAPTAKNFLPEEERRKPVSLAIETQDDDMGIPPPPQRKTTSKSLVDMMESPHSAAEPLSPTLRTANGRTAIISREQADIQQTNSLQPIQEKTTKSSSIDESIHIHSQENMPPSPTDKKRGLWSRLVPPKSKATPLESQTPMTSTPSHPIPPMQGTQQQYTKNYACQLVSREQLFQELEVERMARQPHRRWASDAAGSLVGKLISPNKEIVGEPLTTTNSDWSLVSRESECLSETNSFDDNDLRPSKGPFRKVQKGLLKRFQKTSHDKQLRDLLSDLDSELDKQERQQGPTPAAAAAAASPLTPAPQHPHQQIDIPPNKGLLPEDLEKIKAGKAGRDRKTLSMGPPSDIASRGSSILPNVDRSDISSHNDSITSNRMSESGVETVLDQTWSPRARKTNLFLDTNALDSNLGAIYVRPSPKLATPMKTTMAGIVKKVSTRMQSPKKATAAGMNPFSSPIGNAAAKEKRLLPPRLNKSVPHKATATNNSHNHPRLNKDRLKAPSATPGRRMIRLLEPKKEPQSAFPVMSNPPADYHSNHVTTVPRASSSIGSCEDQSIEIIDGSQQGITATFSYDDGSTNLVAINPRRNPLATNPATKVPDTSSSSSVILKTTVKKLESMRKAEPVIVETVQSKSDSESSTSIGLNSNKVPPVTRTLQAQQTPTNSLSSRAENNNGETPTQANHGITSKGATLNTPTNHLPSYRTKPNGFTERSPVEKDGNVEPTSTQIRQDKDSPVDGESDEGHEELEVNLSWDADARNNSVENYVDQEAQKNVGTTTRSRKAKSEYHVPKNNLFRRAFKTKNEPEAMTTLTEKSKAKTEKLRVINSPRRVRLESREDEPSSPIETPYSQQASPDDMTSRHDSSTFPSSTEQTDAPHDKKAVRFSEEPAMIHEIPAIQSGSVTIDSRTSGRSSSPTPSEDTFSSSSSSTTSSAQNSSPSRPLGEPRKTRGILFFVRRKPKRSQSKRAAARDRMESSTDRQSPRRQGVPNNERRSSGSPDGGNTTEEEGIELIARRSKTGKNAILISKSNEKGRKDSPQPRSRSSSRSRSPYRRSMTPPTKGKGSLLGNRLFGQRLNKPGKRSQAQAHYMAQRNESPLMDHGAEKTEWMPFYDQVSSPELKNNGVAGNSEPRSRREPSPTEIATNVSNVLSDSVATDEAEPGSSVGTDQTTDSSLRMDTTVENSGGDFLSWLFPGIFGPIPTKAPQRRPITAGMRAHADELSSACSSSSSRMIGDEEWQNILSATETLAVKYQEVQTMDDASGKSISEETIRNVNTAISTFKEYARRFGVDEKQLMEAVRDDDRSLHSSKRDAVRAKKDTGGADLFLQMFDYYFSPDEAESNHPVSVDSTAAHYDRKHH